MWWGEDMDGVTPKLQLFTSDNVAVADGTGEYTMESRTYPFLDTLVSQYTVHLDKETLDGAVEYGGSEGARLDYYKNDKLLRQEALSFRLCNLRGQARSRTARPCWQNCRVWAGTLVPLPKPTRL